MSRPKLPDGLDNSAQTVLAYRGVWEECFNVPGAKNVDGWKLRDVRERVGLIYFVPLVTAIQPATGSAGTTIALTGTGFDGARAVHLGSVPASSMHVNSDAEIAATVPPGRGAVAVTVISRAGVASNSVASFDYVTAAAAPACTNHKP